MRYQLSLVVLLSLIILAGCGRGVPERPAAPTSPVEVTLPPSTTAAPTEPPMVPATATPTLPATEAAFVSVLPTPTWTPTLTPSPTPWPTLTPLPAVPAATPVVSGLPPLNVGWIQPVGYWRANWGRQLLPLTWRSDDLLIIGGDQFGAPLQAISIDDGTMAWQYAPPSTTDDGVHTPIDSVAIADGIVAVQTDHKLLALDNQDGQPIWNINLGLQKDVLAADSNRIYLRDTSVYPTQVAALDADTGEERWRFDCPAAFDPVLAARDWLLIACQSDASTLVIAQLSAETGALLHLQPVAIQRFDIMGNEQGVLVLRIPVPALPGYNPAVNERYQLKALDWETGNVLWEAYFDGPFAAAVDDDGVLIAVGNQFQRRALRTGDTRWVTTLPVADYGLRVVPPVPDSESLLVGSESGFLYALDRQTGDLLWMEDLWGQLDLPWQPVTPLGADGDTILAWMSVADGDAVAGLRRERPLVVWSTPTFVANSVLTTPATPAPTATPLFSATPPPAGWTPEPLTWKASNIFPPDDAEQTAQNYLLTWLTLHPGDYDGFNQMVSQWPPIKYVGAEGSFDFPSDYVSWVEYVDLDGDGSQEDVVAFGLHAKNWIVLKNDQQGSHIIYNNIRRKSPPFAIPLSAFADDINCDGATELVVQALTYSTFGDSYSAQIWQWDRKTWRDLGTIWGSGNDADQSPIRFEDIDGDGCLEGIARVHPVKMSFMRPQTQIYTFQNGRYERTETRGDPDTLSLFRVIDANRSLSDGDLDSALTLALQALEDPESGRGLSSGSLVDAGWAEARIATYAAAEAMLVHALRNEPEPMHELLTQVEATYDRPDNPFLPAARTMGDTFDATGDALAACQAMERSIRLWNDGELLLFASERLEIEQICPLD